ncbi:immunoglobulin superfamily member 6 isoform X1 [Alligator sinensis]|uniref:immunoglobulin superfamily member 6 isoform X1 n=1 Tax=Alligator sinensis TaxID=38654 RepID=UPI0003C26D0B|nr:immunoglobulin superfamily member 6 isoform X1 [Alligator sinensis]
MALFKCKLILAVKFTWFLHNVGSVIDTCEVTVAQPSLREVDYTVSTVNITCSFSASGCSGSAQVLWFRFLAHKHEALCTPLCTNTGKFKVTEPSKNNVSLQISHLTVNDSAVYFCGVAFSQSFSPTSKQTGEGTILVVREGTGKSYTEEYTLMIVLSSLLFLYNTTILSLFIIYYKSKSKLLKKTERENENGEQHKHNSGRRVFQAIAQELYRKRYAENCHRTEILGTDDDSIYQNR